MRKWSKCEWEIHAPFAYCWSKRDWEIHTSTFQSCRLTKSGQQSVKPPSFDVVLKSSSTPSTDFLISRRASRCEWLCPAEEGKTWVPPGTRARTRARRLSRWSGGESYERLSSPSRHAFVSRFLWISFASQLPFELSGTRKSPRAIDRRARYTMILKYVEMPSYSPISTWDSWDAIEKTQQKTIYENIWEYRTKPVLPIKLAAGNLEKLPTSKTFSLLWKPFFVYLRCAIFTCHLSE